MVREGALTLRMWPWRAGLATAGQQTSVPETSLWKAQDVTAGLDGLLQKRPGLKQWGQTLKESDTWFEPLVDSVLSGWIEVNDDNTLLTYSINQGVLLMGAVAGAGNETLTLSRSGTVSTDASVRLVVQVAGVKAYTASDTNADTFHFRIAKDATTGWEFAIWSGGLYYKQLSDDTYVLVTDSEDIGAGAWSTVEIRVDADGNTTVYLNDTLIDTIATSLLAAPSLTTANTTMEMAAEVQDSGASGVQYGVRLVTPMLSQTVTDPFTAKEVSAISDFRASVGGGALRRTIMCAAGDYIYHDADLTEVWRPVVRKTYENVSFAPYRKQMAWVEHNGFQSSKLWLWTGASSDQPEQQDESPRLRFVAEHQTRVWGAGDPENPLRVYYAADREPNVWFAPDANNISDRFDTQLKAGYLEIPSRKGDRVTAIFGDYFGQLLVFTRQGVYRVTGAGPQSYSITSVTQDAGCESEEAVDQVGNDVWFLSREGVHTVGASDKFGDLLKGFASGAIHDLWGDDASTTTPINKTYISEGRVRYNSTLGLVYVALPLTTDETAKKIFVYNTILAEWYGPWQIDSKAMDKVEIASPVSEVVMHGGAAGQVLYTNQLHKSDNGTAITSVVESAVLNGRSIDPQLQGLEKTWKRMRIYVLPRGDWDLKVFWKVDSEFYKDADTSDPNQNYDTNVFDVHALTEEFRLDEDPDGRLHSREEMGYIEVQLDKRGYGLSFKIQQDGDGEDFAIQGIEIDFIPHGYSRD